MKEPPIDFQALPPVEGGSRVGAIWQIAWGHLRSKKVDAALSVVTLLAILGVMLAVAIMNCVVAVMTGFSDDLRDKILGANAHVVVFKYGGNLADYEAGTSTIEAIDGVEAAAPFVYSELMVRSEWSHTGAVVKGVDRTRTGRVTHILNDLTLGYEGDLATPEARAQTFDRLWDDLPAIGLDGEPLVTEGEPELPGIVLGSELAGQLQVGPGDKLQLINPLGGGMGPLGMPTPSIIGVRVAGVFHSGMYEYDTKWAYVAMSTAQDFLKIGPTASGIEIKVRDIDSVERITREIDETLGFPYYSRHWKELNGKLFEALELEKWVASLLFSLVLVIASALIVSTLLMVVLTKGREIAILKAMGASSSTVLRVFMVEGSVIGLAGSAVGTVLGLLGCWGLDRYEFPLETDVYYLSTVPVVVDPTAVASIGTAAFVASFVLTLYPAWRASTLDPVEALRYE